MKPDLNSISGGVFSPDRFRGQWDRDRVLYLIDVAAILITLSGFYMALKNFRRFPEGQPSGGKPHDRAHFQCILGMIFSLGFVVVNLAIALPRWIMSPCS